MSFWKHHHGRSGSAGRSRTSLPRAKGGRPAFANRVFHGRSLRLEKLEDRCVLSVATVNTALDVVNLSDGVTSLREAVFFTNILAGDDTIRFDASLHGQTISLSLGELAITDSLMIEGPGLSLLTIDASGNDPTPLVNNADGSLVFRINDNSGSSINVSISGLTLTGGDSNGDGGAIFNRESLTIRDMIITGNATVSAGGGIYAEGPLLIATSTISDNVATDAGGGGVFSADNFLVVSDSTFKGNWAGGRGGGLHHQNNGFTIINSTFSGNSAGSDGGGIYAQPTVNSHISHSTVTGNSAAFGGGISAATGFTTTLEHTIVAGNTRSSGSRDDIAGALSARYSLVGDGTGATIANIVGNQIGTGAAPINPLLGALANNGGPTQTHALLAGSPAIDAGDPLADEFDDLPENDQRGAGFDRIQNGAGTGVRIDIGAYEVQDGSISGHKWNDLDGDGIWDQPDEPGLPGWIIFLDNNRNGSLDADESWTITDSSGAYAFDELPPANYTVAEVMLPGWTQTSPGGPVPTSLVANGGFETGTFTGWVPNGFVINNGTFDPSSPDGPLPPYEGQFSALWNAGGGVRDVYQTVTLPTDEPLTLNWAHRVRNHHPVFVDVTQEARVEVRSTTNQVLATLFSTNPGDQLLQDWTEHSADLSAFAGQTVRIAFTVQANSFFLNFHVDDVSISVGDPVGAITVTVAEGQVVEEVNFGNWIEPTGEIRGYKWHDLNGNGVWDQPTEPGLAGWTIYIDANDNGGLDSGEKWTTTAADGSYMLTGLPAGDYLVSELVTPGWRQTSPAPIDTSALIVNGDFETGTFAGWTQQFPNTFVINNGTVDPFGSELPLPPYDGNFSALTTASGPTVSIYQDVTIPANSHLRLEWVDRVRNTQFQFQDPNIEYRVEIRNTANAVLATLFSTNPGDQLLQDWRERSADLSAFAGQTVRIAFTKGSSSGLYIHLDNVRITNARPVSAIPVTIGIGEIAENVNFGNWIAPLAEIHGYKWHDLNGNGQWEQPQEPPLAGTIIYIDANENGSLDYEELWTTTAADGSYSFTDLPAGDYVVSEIVPQGWSQTFPGEDEVPADHDRLFALRGTGSTLTIVELNPTTGALIRSFAAPVTGSPNAQGLALGPNSLFFIDGNSSAPGHTLWELDPDTGAVIDADVVDAQISGQITGAAYLDGKVYLSKAFNGQILVWDAAADTLSATLTVSPNILLAGFTGAADLDVLFGVSSNGTIFRIDPHTGALLATFILPALEGANGLAYVNGELLAGRTGSSGNGFRINPTTGAQLGTITLGGTGNVSALAGDGANFLQLVGSHFVTLAENEIVTDINFGNWVEPPAEIHGFKWYDLDGDGTWDVPEEPPLAGWLIYLDANKNNALDNNERWTVTAADGSYSFTGLVAGEYVVTELLQPGWTQTAPNFSHPEPLFALMFPPRGGSQSSVHQIDPATGTTLNIFAAPSSGTIFGNEGLAVGPRSLFYIQGSNTGTHTLFELDRDTGAVLDADIVDANHPGVIDGLAYLNGKVYVLKPATDRILVWDPVADGFITLLTVTNDLAGGLTGAADLGVLYAPSSSGKIFAIHPLTGQVLATITPTSSIGFQSGLAYVGGKLISVRSSSPGTTYEFDPLTGQLLRTFLIGGTNGVGALGGDGIPGLSPGAHVVKLAPGQAATNVNFGNWIAGPAEIHGVKWNDLDQDKVWDQPTEPGLAGWTIYLDANGNGQLDAGETSTVTAADGSYSFTGLAPGLYIVKEVLQTGWAATFALPFVSLDVGERATNINFGNSALPGSIRGTKWNDLNGNGVRDVGEPGLADWAIFIDSDANGVFDEGERGALTAADGTYMIDNVPAGSHTVLEVLQSGWAQTYAPPVVVVAPALAVTGIDFGNRALPGSIQGQKWNDLDADGVKDDGEPGLPGWTIYIDGNANGVLDAGEQSATTDASGNYALTGLAPGEYLVAEVQQPGWQPTTPTTFHLDRLLTALSANHAAISALVPNRYDFTEGETNTHIVDGGNDMYNTGNFIAVNDNTQTPYTNGTLTDSDRFGLGSQYFTAKFPGLFVLAASNAAIENFEISSSTSVADRGVRFMNNSYFVNGRQFTVFSRRLFGGTVPSINELIIVPGDGAGILHGPSASTFESHRLTSATPIRELYYVLVSTTNGGFLPGGDVQNIARAFLANVVSATDNGARQYTVGPGQEVTNANFGNLSVPLPPGDYNRDNSVDAADYVYWRKFAGTTGAPVFAGADGNGDATIDAADREIWATHFGETAATGASVATGDPQTLAIGAASSSDADEDAAVVPSTKLASPAFSPFETSMARRITSRPMWARESGIDAEVADAALDVALRSWLSLAARQIFDAETDDVEPYHGEYAGDEYFDTLETSPPAIDRRIPLGINE